MNKESERKKSWQDISVRDVDFPTDSLSIGHLRKLFLNGLNLEGDSPLGWWGENKEGFDTLLTAMSCEQELAMRISCKNAGVKFERSGSWQASIDEIRKDLIKFYIELRLAEGYKSANHLVKKIEQSVNQLNPPGR